MANNERFDINRSDREAYRRFIERMRLELQQPGSYSHNRPVLPPQQNPPTSWIDLELQSGDRVLVLRIRRDNLYLDGYRFAGADQWFEFNNRDNLHLINGSTFLGFDGSYIGLERTASRGRQALNLGRKQLSNAVNELATANNNEISDFLVDIYESDGAHPSTQIISLENGWGDVSTALLRADDNPTLRVFPLPPNDMGIRSALDAVAAIGILLHKVIPRDSWPRMTRSAEPRMDSAPWLEPKGRALVEIFSVRMNNIDGESTGELYGTIAASDGLSTQSIYDRKKDNVESISKSDKALLTGPSRCISAAGSFVIDVHLWDWDLVSYDDEVSNGKISWNVYDSSGTFDRFLSRDVVGTYGSVTVNYAILSNAAQASVTLILINGDGEGTAEVYGNVVAKTKFGECELFRKERNDYISVSEGEPISLLRSSVAVAMNDKLIIEAKLWDEDTVSSDDEIANGTVQFDAAVFTLQSIEKSIYGKYGEVKVRVAWY